MAFWPFWMIIAAAGIGLAAAYDRVALIGFVTLFAGLFAMRYPSDFPVVFALTVWVSAASIIISTGQSLAASVAATLIPVFYLASLVGLPWSVALFLADVAGCCALLALFISTGLSVSGSGGDRTGYFDSGALPGWAARAVPSLARGAAREEATE